MNTMYSVMEPQLKCLNLWQVCNLLLKMLSSPLVSFNNPYSLWTKVGWPSHEWRYWPRYHKGINCICCPFGCSQQQASRFVCRLTSFVYTFLWSIWAVLSWGCCKLSLYFTFLSVRFFSIGRRHKCTYCWWTKKRGTFSNSSSCW